MKMKGKNEKEKEKHSQMNREIDQPGKIRKNIRGNFTEVKWTGKDRHSTNGILVIYKKGFHGEIA